MTDGFAAWKLLQDRMLMVQKAQVEAATKLIGMNENFSGAVEAAQKVAEANMQAWEAWMSVWGVKK